MSQFLSSSELFINVKNPPTYNPKKHFFDQSPDVIQFYLEELEKIQKGVNIGGYHLHPWLYWHINFFKTPIPVRDNTGRMSEVIMNPPLDDNFMWIVENYAEAEAKSLGMFLYGCRGSLKSTSESSLITWLNTSKPNGTTSVIGGDEGDLNNISKLISVGFNNIHPAFFIPQIIGKWDSKVELGIKEKDGFKIPHSHVNIINANKGTSKSSEKGAGASPVGFIIDEGSKFSMKGVLQSALPSFVTPYGAKLVHVIAATSGNQELSKDAKDIITNPEAYRLLPMDWQRLERAIDKGDITWERSKKEKFSVFFPGQMSYRLAVPKLKSNLAKHLGVESDILEKIEMNTTNWTAASKLIRDTNASFKKEEDREKNRMYFPLEIADCWLTESKNPFPTPIIDRHLRRLEDEGKGGKPVEFYKEDNKQKFEFSAKKFAPTYYDGGIVDSPILLFGAIPETPPLKYIYVGGLDSYKLDGAASEGSLGAYYIIKRRSLEANETCEKIVLAYAARPERQREFNENCMQGMKVFNAMTNIESVDLSYQQYLDDRGLAEEYLCPAFRFSSSHDHKQPQLNSKFGLYPNTQNNEFRIRYLIEWCKEEHVVDVEQDGQPIIKYGVEFIEDIELLREMMEFKQGGNYDRIAAFSHALVYARELDRKEILPERKKDLNAEIKRVKTNKQQPKPYTNHRYNPYS